MSRHRLTTAALIVAFCFLGAANGLARAGGFDPVQRYPFDPIQKYESFPAQKYPVPAYSYVKPVPTECCQPKVIYRHHRCFKKRSCCCCQSPYQVVLPVPDPRCCTRMLEIPVPVPPCCHDVPLEKVRGGLFVRGVATYKWSCGYMVRVILRHNGDAVVHTFGVPIRQPVMAYPAAHSVYSPTPAPPPPQYSDGPELTPATGYDF